MEIGYARVSTLFQNEDRQIAELMKRGIKPCNIYVDRQSGKDFEREQYKRMFKRLTKKDILVIKSIDRLGRNYNEILEQWRLITKVKKANVIVVDMPLLNTTVFKGLLSTFISDLVLQLLSFVAENERNMILQRQEEGIAAAKARGVKFGRPPIDMPEDYEKYYALWKEKKMTAKQAAEKCKIPLWAFYKKKPF